MRGANYLLIGAALAVAGCAANDGIQVRPIADRAAKYRYSGSLADQGRAQLAFGNAGIALETFRKLQREQPESVDAFAGIAACYAAMGRFDLARSNYEYALAYAPTDRGLLTALASTLERLGKADQAARARVEAAALASPAPTPVQVQPHVVTPIGVARAGSVTVKLPPVGTQLSAGAPAPVAIAHVLPTTEAPPPARPAPVDALASDRPVAARPAVVDVAAVERPLARRAIQADSFVIDVPAPPRAPVAAAVPADRPREPAMTARVAVIGEPYLQRSSTGEVSLITLGRPAQIEMARGEPRRPAPAPRTAEIAAVVADVRWVPLRYASAQQDVRLLNAARSQALAARTRDKLLDRGWRKIAIGNARQVRERTLVLYAPARATTARRLAAHFGCKAVKAAGVRGVLVLLGRDAVLRRQASARA